jgi:hypothetical protein
VLLSIHSAGCGIVKAVVACFFQLRSRSIYGIFGEYREFGNFVCHNIHKVVIGNDIMEGLVPYVASRVFDSAASLAGGPYNCNYAAITEGCTDSAPYFAAPGLFPGLRTWLGKRVHPG